MQLRNIVMGLAVWTALGIAAMAQDTPQEVTVTLTNYAFTPNAIVLKAGVTVRLHLVNAATKSHSFSAPQFFAASVIADQAKMKNGTIELDGGQSADVTVTPGGVGTYPLRCTHFLHAGMGMAGTITVQ